MLLKRFWCLHGNRSKDFLLKSLVCMSIISFHILMIHSFIIKLKKNLNLVCPEIIQPRWIIQETITRLRNFGAHQRGTSLHMHELFQASGFFMFPAGFYLKEKKISHRSGLSASLCPVEIYFPAIFDYCRWKRRNCKTSTSLKRTWLWSCDGHLEKTFHTVLIRCNRRWDNCVES